MFDFTLLIKMNFYYVDESIIAKKKWGKINFVNNQIKLYQTY